MASPTRTLVLASLALAAMLPLGARAAEAGDCQPDAVQALAALNALRASAHSCGPALAPAAPPLRWDPRLASSARLYAEELTQRDTLSHEGRAVRSLSERLRSSGFVGLRAAGENLAAGLDDLDEVLRLWLDSRDHCQNLMQADFRDAGLACVASPGRYGHFWVLHLGRSARD
jgi:uncharacterized protein YkwD